MIDEPRRAAIEILWEGGARTELEIRLWRRGAKRTCTPEDTIELIRRLAEHHPDNQIASILNKQGRRTGTGLLFSEPRVKYVRQQNNIPAAPPPDPDSGIFTIKQAAGELGVTETTIYRWLREGLLPGEQTTPHAPWRIHLTPEIRARFVPDVPDDYLPLDLAAKRLGCARQTVLHKVQRGELPPSRSSRDGEKAYEFRCCSPQLDCLTNDDREEGSVNHGSGGPSRITFSRACRKSSWPRCSITVFFTDR